MKPTTFATWLCNRRGRYREREELCAGRGRSCVPGAGGVVYREGDERGRARLPRKEFFYCVVAAALCNVRDAMCFFKRMPACVRKYALIQSILQVVRSICGDLAEDVSKVYHSIKKTTTKKILKFFRVYHADTNLASACFVGTTARESRKYGRYSGLDLRCVACM